MIDIVLDLKENMLEMGYEHVERAVFVDMDKAKKIPKGDLVIAKGGNTRALLERGKVDAIMGLENHGGRDFMHHRNSGLNQVLCKIAAQKGVMVCIALPDLLSQKGHVLGRIRQNIKLCRKYGVKIGFASLAKDRLGMRNPNDVKSFLEVLGMHPKEAKDALEVFGRRISLNKARRDPDYICEGITKK